MSLDIEKVTSHYKVFDYQDNIELSGLLDFIDSLLTDSVEIIHLTEQFITEPFVIDGKPFPQVEFTVRFLTDDWESLGIKPIKILTDLKYGYMYLSWVLKEKYEDISIYALKLN